MGDLRVTVPLPGRFATDVEYRSRIVVAPDLVFVPLDQSESRRLAESYYRVDTGVRLELSGLASSSREDRSAFSAKLRNYLDILTLLTSQVSSDHFAVVDRYSGQEWVRDGRLNWMGPAMGDTSPSYLSRASIAAWAECTRNWPSSPDKALMSALSYHCEAVADALAGRFGRAVVASAIAAEVVLGDSQTTEVTYRMSLRAGHLLGETPDEAEFIRRQTAALYGLRSRVVHSGKPVTFDDANSWVNLSARLVLAAAAFSAPLKEMKQELESENFAPRQAIRALHASPRDWWKRALDDPGCDVAPPINWMLPPDEGFM